MTCPAGGWTLTSGECQRTVPVKETRTTVDQVPYEVKYTVRVAPFTAQIRVAPYTETVRIAPFTETVTQTYTRRQRYCAQYDIEFNSGCLRWAYRNVTETVTETVDAYNYEKRNVYNYQTVDAYNYETRTRWECCKSVIREKIVTVNRVEKLDSGPIRTCPAKFALDTNTNHCKRPPGTDLGKGSPVCSDATWALDSSDWKCSRILPGVVRYACNNGDSEISPPTTPRMCRAYTCPADYVLDPSTSPPMCYRYVCSAGYDLDTTASTPKCFRYVCDQGYELDELDANHSTPTCTYIECPDGQHRFTSEPVSSCHDDHDVPSPCSVTYARHSADNTHHNVPCPTNIACTVSGGYLARQMHRHTDTRGHANCDVHPREVCTGPKINGVTMLWIPPGGGHEQLLLECDRRTTKSGIVDPNTTLWSPFDVDSLGRPILCPESSYGVTLPNSDVGDKLMFCMEHYQLAVVGYASGYDLEAAIREYEKEQGVALSPVVQNRLKWLENTFAQTGPVLVSTSPLSPKTASLFDNSKEEEIICGALTSVGFSVAGGVVKLVLRSVPYIGGIVFIVKTGGTDVAKSITCGDSAASNSSASDVEPTVLVSIPDVQLREGDPTVSYTVVLDAVPIADTVVTVSSNNADVTVQPASLTFTSSNWQVPQTVTVSAGEDLDMTDDVAVITHQVSGSDADDTVSVSIAVTDDDVPEVSITAASAGITEGSAAVFTLTATPVPAAPLTVTVTVTQSGDFTDGADTRTVTIPANTVTAALTIATVGDSADEPDGSITAALVGGQRYTLGSAASATVDVVDDDNAPQAGSLDCDSSGVNASKVTVAEPSGWFAVAVFEIALCGDNWGNTMINYHVEHITTDDDDFQYVSQGMLIFAPFETTATARVMVVHDGKAEGDETFALVLSDVYSYRSIDLGTGRVLGTITD